MIKIQLTKEEMDYAWELALKRYYAKPERIRNGTSLIEKDIDLPEDAKKAVIAKKIQLGHALLLAKMPKNDAAKLQKETTGFSTSPLTTSPSGKLIFSRSSRRELTISPWQQNT